MNVRRCLSLALLLAGIVAPAQNAPPAANAALLYWQAIAALTPAPKPPDKIWEHPLEPELVGAVDAAQAALDLVRAGTAIPRCHWGIPDNGPATLLPQMSKVRDLGRGLCLDARVRLSRGDSTGAIADLADCLALASHIGQDQVLIGFLVQCSLEDLAIQGLARNFGAWSKTDLEYLEQRLDHLPPGGSVAGALRAEQQFFAGWGKRFVATLNADGKLDATLDRLAPLLPAGEQLAALKPVATPGESADLIDKLNDEHYAQVAPLLGLPPRRADVQALRAESEALLKNLPLHRRGEALMLLGMLLQARNAARAEGKPDRLDEILTRFERTYDPVIALATLPLSQQERRAREWGERLQREGDFLSRLAMPALGGVFGRGSARELRLTMLRAAIKRQLQGEAASLAVVDPGNPAQPFAVQVEGQRWIFASALTANGKPVTIEFNLQPPTPPAALPAEPGELDQADRERLLKLQATLGKLARPSPDDERAVHDEMRKWLGANPKLNPEQVDEKAALSLGVDAAIEFGNLWLPVLDEALRGDGSARAAALLLSRQDLPTGVARQLFATHPEELRHALGENNYRLLKASYAP